MTLEQFLKKFDEALRENPARHPARTAFDLARAHDATITFAGPDGDELGEKDFEAFWKKGGPDPFIDEEGRATIRIKASHRISDWAVINARLTIRGLDVEKRYYMLRSWVIQS